MSEYKKIKTNNLPERKMLMPLVKGPFRGVIISFHQDTNFNNFKDDYFEMTFNHNNFYRTWSDKQKTIIYYKNPYDAATIISKFESNKNYHISLYYDQLSKTLHPEVLYITGTISYTLLPTIKQLQGRIITETKKGIQVKFKNCKNAAIAQEEIRKEFKVKFAYKSEIPNKIDEAKSTQTNTREIPSTNEKGLSSKKRYRKRYY